MMTMNKKGEIRQFSNQVRVICVKNDIDKPTLGNKIGMDNKKVFTALKNNAFKPSVSNYFRLETYICGNDANLRSKLRTKYERTLTVEELESYLRSAINVENMEKKHKEFRDMSNVVKEVKPAVVTEKKVEKSETIQKSTTNRKARHRFWEILNEHMPENLKYADINEIMGKKSWFVNLKQGSCFPLVEHLQELFDVFGIKEGTDVYNELLDLELSCIAGRYEEDQLEKYDKLFGNKVKKTVENNTDKVEKTIVMKAMPKETVKEVIEEEKAAEESSKDNTAESKREFANILTRWLFVKGYTFQQAARNIGCSESEFKSVVNGDICLSPFHVSRFKETLGMENDNLDRLIKLSNSCYEGHEVPKHIIEYLSSDIVKIRTLEKIIKLGKDASFWEQIEKTL